MTPTDNGTVRVSFKGKMPQLVKFYYTTDGTPATPDSSDPIEPSYTEGYAELPIVGKWDFDLNVCAVSSNNKTITASQRIEMDICQVERFSEEPFSIPKGKGIYQETKTDDLSKVYYDEYIAENDCEVTFKFTPGFVGDSNAILYRNNLLCKYFPVKVSAGDSLSVKVTNETYQVGTVKTTGHYTITTK